MVSKWIHLKDQAIERRKAGESIKNIQKELGVPISTLSGWLRNIDLSKEQKTELEQRRLQGLRAGREKAVVWHNMQKARRLELAQSQADAVLNDLDLENRNELELALAFLYLGEGGKGDSTSLGSSDPVIARFFINSLKNLYELPTSKIKCYLHLRADQDDAALKKFWSDRLEIPLENFGKSSVDPRTSDRETYKDYKGVCLIECGRVDIQRRLMYIATGYSDRIIGRLAHLARARD